MSDDAVCRTAPATLVCKIFSEMTFKRKMHFMRLMYGLSISKKNNWEVDSLEKHWRFSNYSLE